jgi:hypothetical protein
MGIKLSLRYASMDLCSFLSSCSSSYCSLPNLPSTLRSEVSGASAMALENRGDTSIFGLPPSISLAVTRSSDFFLPPDTVLYSPKLDRFCPHVRLRVPQPTALAHPPTLLLFSPTFFAPDPSIPFPSPCVFTTDRATCTLTVDLRL